MFYVQSTDTVNGIWQRRQYLKLSIRYLRMLQLEIAITTLERALLSSVNFLAQRNVLPTTTLDYMFYVNERPLLTQKSKLPSIQLSYAFNVFLEHPVAESTAAKTFSSPVMSNLQSAGFFYLSPPSNPLVPTGLVIYTRMPVNSPRQTPDVFTFIAVVMPIRHTKLHAFPDYIFSLIYVQFGTQLCRPPYTMGQYTRNV
jgi:hypothetical protein